MSAQFLDPAPLRTGQTPFWAPFARRAAGAMAGLALTAAAAIVARAVEPYLDSAHVGLVFVAPVILTAIWFGATASVVTAMLCVLAINFFFVTPRYTFGVARSQDLWALGVFVLVALTTSFVAAQARAARLDAARRAAQAETLRSYARDLAAAQEPEEIRRVTTTALSQLSGGQSACIGAEEFGGDAADDATLTARWAMSTKKPASSAAIGGAGRLWRFWPVLARGRCDWAVGILASAPPSLDVETLIEQIAAHASVAFERARQASIAGTARFDAERERLKTLLLAGVSHDLRTPLASMLLSLESIRRFEAIHDQAAKAELLAVAESEARRLSAMVEDLLSAARLDQGGEPARNEEMRLQDIVAKLMPDARLSIDAESIAGLPPALGDAALAERALANVVDNALKYSGGGKVSVRGEADIKSVRLIVEDEGPGLGDDPDALFQVFVRGVEGDGRAPGLGLGLALARAYQKAQNGSLSAENRPTRGAEFTLEYVRCAPQAAAS